VIYQLGKLYSYWLGSDRQMRDVAHILQVRAGKTLDLEKIGEWARAFAPGLYQAWIETLDALSLER